MISNKESGHRLVKYLPLILCLSIVPVCSAATRGAAWSGATTDISAHDSIGNAISYVPGIHFRALMETVNRTNGVVQYHVRQMEVNHEIFAVNFGHLKGYFPNFMRKFSRKELLAIVASRHPLRNAIILALLEGPKTSSELSIACEEESNKILFHLKKLIEIGAIIEVDSGKYCIAGDLLATLQRYMLPVIAPRIVA